LIALLSLLVRHPAFKHGGSGRSLSVRKIHAAVCVPVRPWLKSVGSALAIRRSYLLLCLTLLIFGAAGQRRSDSQ
jgi:hypothetical protein